MVSGFCHCFLVSSRSPHHSIPLLECAEEAVIAGREIRCSLWWEIHIIQTPSIESILDNTGFVDTKLIHEDCVSRLTIGTENIVNVFHKDLLVDTFYAFSNNLMIFRFLRHMSDIKQRKFFSISS